MILSGSQNERFSNISTTRQIKKEGKICSIIFGVIRYERTKTTKQKRRALS